MTNQSDPGPLPEFDPGTELNYMYTVELTPYENGILSGMARSGKVTPAQSVQNLVSAALKMGMTVFNNCDMLREMFEQMAEFMPEGLGEEMADALRQMFSEA